MRISLVAGARPNFIKIAPIVRAIENHNKNTENEIINFRLIHTGQHYDRNMSETFFDQLNIPKPNINLECGGGTQAEQTASIMVEFEKDLLKNPTDIVLVVGDVTSTLACSITAKKLHIDVGHVEAGIRSNDLHMPEEINRMVTDSICDILFTTTLEASQILLNLGIAKEKIHFVGNVMIDTLLANFKRLRKPSFFDKHNLTSKNYLVLTMHRPSNVDKAIEFKELLESIVQFANDIPIIFPVHPRTLKSMEEFDLNLSSLITVSPMGYLEFIYLIKNSKAVLTDSGGITEETTVMNIPCITLRDTTERPETITQGTNVLVGKDINKLKLEMDRLHSGNWKKGQIPELWDGNSAERILDILLKNYG